jgi:echinoid protein
LTPNSLYRVGDSEFSATCGAQGKPKPSIRWLKDGHEIINDPKLYDISTDESEGRNSVFTVQSTLRFLGNSRPEGSQLVPADRGLYSCAFENEVKKAESSMHLRIEREFLVLDIFFWIRMLCPKILYPSTVILMFLFVKFKIRMHSQKFILYLGYGNLFHYM